MLRQYMSTKNVPLSPVSILRFPVSLLLFFPSPISVLRSLFSLSPSSCLRSPVFPVSHLPSPVSVLPVSGLFCSPSPVPCPLSPVFIPFAPLREDVFPNNDNKESLTPYFPAFILLINSTANELISFLNPHPSLYSHQLTSLSAHQLFDSSPLTLFSSAHQLISFLTPVSGLLSSGFRPVPDLPKNSESGSA